MLQDPNALLRDTGIDNPILPKDGIVEEHDPLSIDIEDAELVKVLEKRIETSEQFFDGDRYRLSLRRERNERYLFGRQIAAAEKASKYRPYEAKYQDNALYEIEASIKPVALSRMPDMIVTPGSNKPQSEETAKQISLIVDTDIKKRENRKVLSLAFKHLPVFFTGIIKVRWNPELGEFGDYEFYNVYPENIVFDEQCPVNNVDKMDFFAEAMKMSVKSVFMRFPGKEAEFIKELNKMGVKVKDPDEWSNMATTVKIWEVWFTWYKKLDEGKYERIEGVLWKFGDCILKKMRNPNYDYEGQEKYFTYEVPEDAKTKREATPEELMIAAVSGEMPENLKKETVYRNYFDMPHKPYYMMGYDQWGKVAIDETSRIEQNIHNQENMDNIGKRIIEKLKDRGKHIFSKDSGLQGKDIERMDLNNPDQDLLVDGNVNNVHGYIQPIEPTSQEFTEIKMARERMFGLAGAQNLTGQLQTDVATSNQIAREANFTRVDDLTEDTINSAAEWMAGWIMQMIKLRYTEEHMRRILGGSKGSFTFVSLKSDMIEDGMEVKIKASGTDKQKRQNNAINMAKMKMIDPLTFYQDMDLNDPEGRTKKMMLFTSDPQGYMMQYVMNMTPEQGAQALINAPMDGQPAQPSIVPSSPTTAPQNPSVANPSVVPTEPPVQVTASPENGLL